MTFIYVIYAVYEYNMHNSKFLVEIGIYTIKLPIYSNVGCFPETSRIYLAKKLDRFGKSIFFRLRTTEKMSTAPNIELLKLRFKSTAPDFLKTLRNFGPF
jgi:hypothetical protein